MKFDSSSVEIVKSTEFPGFPLAQNLGWSLNTLQPKNPSYVLPLLLFLTTFSSGTNQIILSSRITSWRSPRSLFPPSQMFTPNVHQTHLSTSSPSCRTAKGTETFNPSWPDNCVLYQTSDSSINLCHFTSTHVCCVYLQTFTATSGRL